MSFKNETFCENKPSCAMIFTCFVEKLLPSSWPEETKAVAEPESLGWSPRNAGIVSIDWML